jgi:hypothetical protein
MRVELFVSWKKHGFSRIPTVVHVRVCSCACACVRGRPYLGRDVISLTLTLTPRVRLFVLPGAHSMAADPVASP